MKILILGGAGAMAYATIRDMLEFDSHETSQLTIADIYYEKVESLAKELNDDRVSVARCDLTDHASLVNTMKGHDIVLNEAPGKYGLLVLNAALEAGAHIIDLGADARSQLELNDQFEKAGLTAILGLGSSPGITNVAAGYLVGKLDTVETIYMSFAYAELVKAVFFIPFLGAIEEFIHNAVSSETANMWSFLLKVVKRMNCSLSP